MKKISKTFRSVAEVNQFFQQFLPTYAAVQIDNTSVTLDKHNWHDDQGNVTSIGKLLRGRLNQTLQQLFLKRHASVKITTNLCGHIKAVWAQPHHGKKRILAFHRSGVVRALHATKSAGKWCGEAASTVALSPLLAMDAVGDLYDAAIEKYGRGGGAVHFS